MHTTHTGGQNDTDAHVGVSQALFDSKPANVDLSDFSAHDVANVLKRYVRELPQPIFTARLQSLFFAALGTNT
jgi:hypothetical protein